MQFTRRRLLQSGAGLAALAAAGATGWHFLARATRAPHVREMARALRTVKSADAVDVALGWVEAGVTRDQLLASAFCAQVLSGADRGDPHAQLVPPSIAALCAAFPQASEAGWLAALWAVEFSAEWLIDAQDPRAAPAGRGEIEIAMHSGDPEVLDAAVVAAFHGQGARGVVRQLAPWATCGLQDPHTPILLAQTAAGLPLLPGDLALPMLRSAGRRLCRRAAPLGDAWEEDQDAAALYAGRADHSEADGEVALDLVGLMAAGEEELVLGQLPRFVKMSSWRAPMIACVLAAAGIMPVSPSASGMGVHASTLADALLTLGSMASAAGRAHMGRRAVRWFTRLLNDHPGALWSAEEELAPPAHLDALVGSNSAVNLTRAWFSAGGEPAEYVRWLALRGLTAGTEAHDFKYSAALLSTAQLIPTESRPATLSFTAASSLASSQRAEWGPAAAARERLRRTLG
jgi:hypothetical protein